jgi:hypothetical protein
MFGGKKVKEYVDDFFIITLEVHLLFSWELALSIFSESSHFNCLEVQIFNAKIHIYVITRKPPFFWSKQFDLTCKTGLVYCE